ncbi:type III toxin-antitoxin system TenpIN family toxin [Mannheimia haemolytica]
MDITTQNIELRYLSEQFYLEVAPYLKEILLKGTRPYCVLLVQVKNLDFALPLRSNLPQREGVGIKTIPNPDEEGRFKGVDFSKAILLTDKSYLKTDKVQLKNKSELLNIQGNERKIVREFKKYVSEYITAIKNSSTLEKKFEYTTLINYHVELKISQPE